MDKICTKFDFGWGSAPDHTGELISAPRPPSCIWGLLLREGEGRGGVKRGGEETGREGRRGRKAFPLFLFYETTRSVYSDSLS